MWESLRHPLALSGRSDGEPVSGPLAALPAAFATDGRFLLPLPLSAGLLVEAALPELGVEAGPLDFPLEPAESPVEAFIVLDDDFQADHAPLKVVQSKNCKLKQEALQGNRPSRCNVWA